MASKSAASEHQTSHTPSCGVIMPIADTEGYPAGHWGQVLEIIQECAKKAAGFEAKMVSDGEHSSLIHGNIVTNIYQNDVVICDVSSRNPNVMLELGLRLASKKPVIVIKDDATPYSFDSSPIKHEGYPKDLRYKDIINFKSRLTDRIKSSLAEANQPGSKSFLDHFSIPDLQLSEVKTESVGLEEYLQRMESRLLSAVQGVVSKSSPPVRSAAIRGVHFQLLDPSALNAGLTDIVGTYFHNVGMTAEKYFSNPHEREFLMTVVKGKTNMPVTYESLDFVVSNFFGRTPNN